MATGKLVVLAAFSKTDEGQLVPAFEPRPGAAVLYKVR